MATQKRNVLLSEMLNTEIQETRSGLMATLAAAIILAGTIFAWVEFNYLIESPRQFATCMVITMFISFFGVAMFLMGSFHTVVRGKKAAKIYFSQLARCSATARGRR